ncbi:hypothetical protein ACFL51_01600 [Myxococcota bacterium]
MTRLGIIIVVSVALLVGCKKDDKKDDKKDGDKSGQAGMASAANLDLSKPGDFLRHLYAVAKAGDTKEWGKQLAKARRDRGEKYVKHHFSAWAPEIIKYVDDNAGGDPGKLETKLTKQDGKRLRLHLWPKGKPDKELKITVSREGGRLVINEN